MTKHLVWAVWCLAVAGCDDDGERCDPNQRLFHGLCYTIDAGTDAAPAAGTEVRPPDLPDTPPAPRSGSGA